MAQKIKVIPTKADDLSRTHTVGLTSMCVNVIIKQQKNKQKLSSRNGRKMSESENSGSGFMFKVHGTFSQEKQGVD